MSNRKTISARETNMGLTATSERHPLLEGPVTREVSGLKSDKGRFFFFSGERSNYLLRNQAPVYIW
jgi:hypothetical protein